ncbi:hypothetical protein H3146_05855 [Streptomyces sp. OF3]|uniref:DUF1295 domain-containing protein n=1 Tax=Streptomyces alkaliterrae TaxID=2213162 RepID=A0A7W3WIC1_9ACTN|nr:hypothetical protein [Streptomyces alkaliterrae]MBB1252891.1 hypothetical protein [Streptomyces alkaliterrae]
MTLALSITGISLLLVAFAAHLAHRIPDRTYYGIAALACLLMLAASVADRRHVSAGIDSATTALFVWLWWTRGGGDRTRRRLRDAARRWTPRRRTATTHA